MKTLIFCLLGTLSLHADIVLVTGASRGIGFETAKILATDKNSVYAAILPGMTNTLAQLEALQNPHFHVIELDVTDAESVSNCIETIYQIEGRIDVLINNAGRGLSGATETCSVEEIEALHRILVIGPTMLYQAVMPIMRAQQSGLIINLSSISAHIGFAAAPYYAAYKSALSHLSMQWRLEAAPFGVKVCEIEPGPVQTEIAKDSPKGTRIPSDCADLFQNWNEKGVAATVELLQAGQPPSEIAEKICAIVKEGCSKPRYFSNDFAAFAVEPFLPDLTGEKLENSIQQSILEAGMLR